MTWLGKVKKLFRQDRGGVAAMVAIMLTSLVALTGRRWTSA